MFILLPKDLLTWIDMNRGSLSRQAFIIECMISYKKNK